jgi:2-oxoisovalerate dehydrogenase E1 component alpha subunit
MSEWELMRGHSRVVFPGAINSEFTSDMSFVTARDLPAIPTFRVMNSDGEIIDKTRGPPNVSDEEVLTWYKNMLQGM